MSISDKSERLYADLVRRGVDRQVCRWLVGSTPVTAARGHAVPACLPAGVGGRAGAPTVCVLEASGLGPTGPCAARAGRHAHAAPLRARLRRGVLTTPAAQVRFARVPARAVGRTNALRAGPAPGRTPAACDAVLGRHCGVRAKRSERPKSPGPNPALSTSLAVHRFVRAVRLARNQISLAVALQMVL
jgi:hypothetical protein